MQRTTEEINALKQKYKVINEQRNAENASFKKQFESLVNIEEQRSKIRE